MIRTQIYLTEEESSGVKEIATSQQRKQSEVIRQAIDEFLVRTKPESKLEKLRKARGLWRKRDDIDLDAIRRDFERFSS